MGGPHSLALPRERKEEAAKYVAVKDAMHGGIRHGRNRENGKIGALDLK